MVSLASGSGFPSCSLGSLVTVELPVFRLVPGGEFNASMHLIIIHFVVKFFNK